MRWKESLLCKDFGSEQVHVATVKKHSNHNEFFSGEEEYVVVTLKKEILILLANHISGLTPCDWGQPIEVTDFNLYTGGSEYSKLINSSQSES